MITFGVKQFYNSRVVIKSIKLGSTTASPSTNLTTIIANPIVPYQSICFFIPEMFKTTFISTILLFAISLVLVHNIISHHHHDEVSDINHYENHHDKQDQNHQGDNDDPFA